MSTLYKFKTVFNQLERYLILQKDKAILPKTSSIWYYSVNYLMFTQGILRLLGAGFNHRSSSDKNLTGYYQRRYKSSLLLLTILTATALLRSTYSGIQGNWGRKPRRVCHEKHAGVSSRPRLSYTFFLNKVVQKHSNRVLGSRGNQEPLPWRSYE